MKNTILIFLSTALFNISLLAQEASQQITDQTFAAAVEKSRGKKSSNSKNATPTFILREMMLDNDIKVDGKLTDNNWNTQAFDFTQSAPDNGKKSKFINEFDIVYDNEYLYLGAKLYVNNKEEINKQLTFRDDVGNSDYFGLTLDPFGNASDGYSFIVTAAGTQYDSKYSGDGGEFDEWNAVWYSTVKTYENYWVVELKIPFNFLRFDKNNLENFKFNLVRFSSKYNEQSWWAHIDAESSGFLNHFGNLDGLNDVNPPINLSFYPFTSIIYENNKVQNSAGFAFAGGLDLKYVYKNSFALDASIIPDFSQTTFDDEVLNLSSFEVKFDENRQFFTEGTDLFNKSNFFYSRRIGESPYLWAPSFSDDEIIENPSTTKILNLTKITGRTQKGFGIGFLNGVVGRAKAKYASGREEIINPLTNYNSIVLDQTLKNNSYIYFANNSILRRGDVTDFNHSEFIFQGFDKNQNYSLNIAGALSQHYGEETLLGSYYKVAAEKVSGKFRSGIISNFYDENFDPNEFGYLDRNNLVSFDAYTTYRVLNPFWKLNGMEVQVALLQKYYKTLWSRELTRFKLSSRFTLKNNDNLTLGSYFRLDGKDFFEPRIEDRYVRRAPNVQPYIEFQSNANNKFSINSYLLYRKYLEDPFKYELQLGYGLNQAIGNRLNINFGQDLKYYPSNLGVLFVDGSQVDAAGNLLFSERNLYNLETTLSANYLINNKMGLSLKTRHFWAYVKYFSTYYVDEKGQYHKSDLAVDFSNRHINLNLFNLDLLYKWQFAPGSELSVNWQFSLNTNSSELEKNYFRNIKSTFDNPGVNTISFKLIYYLDFNHIQKYVQ